MYDTHQAHQLRKMRVELCELIRELHPLRVAVRLLFQRLGFGLLLRGSHLREDHREPLVWFRFLCGVVALHL